MLGSATGVQSPAVSESVNGKLSLFDRRLNILEANVARLVEALGERENRRQEA
jgi:hypothetical protein